MLIRWSSPVGRLGQDMGDTYPLWRCLNLSRSGPTSVQITPHGTAVIRNDTTLGARQPELLKPIRADSVNVSPPALA